MIYTCPKCGKKMDLSTEVLINSEYKVICPQCLCELQIVGDYAYIPNETLKLDTSIEPSRTINCPICGHEASTGAHFCPNCGTSFDASPKVPSPAEPTAASPIEDVTVLPPPMPGNDPLYNDAVQFLMTCTAITPMMLRDHFNISPERAAGLIRQLEEGGVIGPYNNGGPRQILIPHRSLYESPVAKSSPSGRPGTGKPQTRTGRGCLWWVIILFFLMLLMRTCS